MRIVARCGHRSRLLVAVLTIVAVAWTAPAAAHADPLGDTLGELHGKISPVLVSVKLTIEVDDGDRQEFEQPGVVIAGDGLTLMPFGGGFQNLPRTFLKKFELIRPDKPEDPIAAKAVSFDTVAEVMFLTPAEPQKDLPFLDVTLAAEPPAIGQQLICFGLLPESAGRRCAFEVARVGPRIGEHELFVTPLPRAFMPLVVVDLEGRFVASAVGGASDPFGRGVPLLRLAGMNIVPAVEYVLEHRNDRPEPWMGVAGLTGAAKEIREAYEVPEGRAAIVIGHVVEGFPAEKAGLKTKDFIIGYDGKPLVKGSTDDETRDVFTRAIKRYRIGHDLPVIVWRDGKEVSLTVKLGEAPKTSAKADRRFNKELGLAVRELVFQDLFPRKLPLDQPGVIVDRLIQSEPAHTGGLNQLDIIRKIEDSPIDSLADFDKTLDEVMKKEPKELVMSVLRGQSENVVVRIDLTHAQK